MFLSAKSFNFAIYRRIPEIKMFLKRVSIVNFKNIKEAKISLSPKINCLLGQNGEGKTNFLDAIYYLSFCRSAFSNNDSQVVNHEEDFFMLEGNYIDDEGLKEDISCGMQKGKRKSFKRNNKEYKRLSLHIGFIPLIFVSPSDSVLIEGSGEERRRLMDMAISQYDSLYIDNLNRYNKALQQRNVLLKQEANLDYQLLDILEEQMAEYGNAVYLSRSKLVDEIIPLFQKFYQMISLEKEEVSLRYISHCQQDDLLKIIRASRPKDIVVGYSLIGVHRDDLEMLISGYPARREGSQGQNKTFLIALKLAQFYLLKRAQPKVCPILLLDDIFDKLDSLRVEQIVRIVASEDFGQIFLTDTNRDNLDKILRSNLSDFKIFSVKNGNVSLEEVADVSS